MINNIVSVTPVTPEIAQSGVSADVVRQVNGVSPVEPTRKSDNRKDLSEQPQSSPQPSYMLKLTVDKDPDTGEFIYKAIDRYTGEVVRQLPQKELVSMRKSATYQAGSVIKTDI